MADAGKKKRPPKLQPVTSCTSSCGQTVQIAIATTQGGDKGHENSSTIRNNETSRLDSFAHIDIDNKTVVVRPDELEVLQQLGSGQYGIVEKVKHRNSNHVMAVKRVFAIPTQDQEARRLLMDVDILVKGTHCPNIIKFYGALLWEGDLWILMELMDCSLDKFYRLAHGATKNSVLPCGQTNVKITPNCPTAEIASSVCDQLDKLTIESTAASASLPSNRIRCDVQGLPSPCNDHKNLASLTKVSIHNSMNVVNHDGGQISVTTESKSMATLRQVPSVTDNAIPDHVLGRIAADVVSALSYLYGIKVIHRDIKPSNILVSRKGKIKLCDFGISGYLVNSVAKTYEAGCRPYMAPERIDPPRNSSGYDIKSDVWSLGITLMEVATGKYPYDGARDFFQQLKMICANEPPRLPPGKFSPLFEQFLTACLKKDSRERANYETLSQHEFIAQYSNLDITQFVSNVIDTM